MPPTINELRVEVTPNTLDKIKQYLPLFGCIDIVKITTPTTTN